VLVCAAIVIAYAALLPRDNLPSSTSSAIASGTTIDWRLA
jgi:hypothetical protein